MTARPLALAAALLAIAAQAHATTDIPAHPLAPTTVGVHLVSHHSSYRQPWNDTNPGLYARWSNGLTLGTLRNSERAQSVYAAWSKDWPLLQTPSASVHAGITLGAVSGYQRAPLLPLVAPSLRIGIGAHAGLRTTLLLNPTKTGASAVHLSAEWSF
jgi:hypothetical protein